MRFLYFDSSIFWYFILIFIMWIIFRFLFILFTILIRKFTEPYQDNINIKLNNVYYYVSYWTIKGGRPYQEDRFTSIKGRGSEDSSLYGVFDGHGGSQASQYCKDNLLTSIVQDDMFESNPTEALKKSFHKIDRDFISLCKRNGTTDGTTAVVALIHNRNIYVANAGDSRCMIVQRGGRVVPLSIDHKPSREDEEVRIKELGGRVIFWGRWRVEGVLAVSRAIGDMNLKPYVTCDPEIISHTITPDDHYVVLASDGLWDVMTNEEVSTFVTRISQRTEFQYLARDLCEEAILLGSTDNITVMVIDLRTKNVETSSTNSNSSSNLNVNR